MLTAVFPRYMYAGRLPETEAERDGASLEVLVGLLVAADKYLLPELQSECQVRLADSLMPAASEGAILRWALHVERNRSTLNSFERIALYYMS